MEYLIEGVSDVGIRKKMNQDAYCYLRAHDEHGTYAMAVMCDGMGGLSKGELASAEVIRAFNSWFENELKDTIQIPNCFNNIRMQWNQIILNLHNKLSVYAEKRGIAMGTTLTAIIFLNDKYLAVNVGDTRLYKIHESFVQITKDHSLVQREIDAGNLTQEDAREDKRNNILLQCIGSNKRVVPDFYEGTIKENEIYLLCSDGFRHKIYNDEMKNALTLENTSSKESIRKYTSELIEKAKDRKETDNISALVIRIYHQKAGDNNA